MSVQIQRNEKFAILALSEAKVSPAFPPDLQIAEGLWALRQLPLPIDDALRADLGRLAVSEIDLCNFALLTKKSSARPNVMDDENKALARDLRELFLGMILEGHIKYRKMFTFGGASEGNGVCIREFSRGWNYRLDSVVEPLQICAASLGASLDNATGVRRICREAGGKRLARGFHAFKQALEARYYGDKIHNFVRAIEALVLPKIGHTRQQFVHRCGTFAGGSGWQCILENIYDLRSLVEHMHAWDDMTHKLKTPPKLRAQRVRQAYALARSCYKRIARSSALVPTFCSDSAIKAFWRRKPDARQAIWGSKLNLSAIP